MCKECREPVLRSDFMIEAKNVFGQSAPAQDWQGTLPGRCYTCCRGQGPNSSEDMFSTQVKDKKTEAQINKLFKKEAQKLHSLRSDVKERDCKRLRSMFFEDIMRDVGKESPTMKKTHVRDYAFALIKAITDDLVDTFSSSPALYSKGMDIFNKYQKIKDQEAQGDQEGIVIPGGQSASLS